MATVRRSYQMDGHTGPVDGWMAGISWIIYGRVNGRIDILISALSADDNSLLWQSGFNSIISKSSPVALAARSLHLADKQLRGGCGGGFSFIQTVRFDSWKIVNLNY